MKISVIVATYNRCDYVRTFLKNLKNLSLPDTVECEVLIMDNNSNDDTKQITAEHAISKNPVIRYIYEPRQDKSYALNTGIREAKGDNLAFTDDDCIPGINKK